MRFIFSFYGLADIIAIISLLLPLLGENLAFLRVVRTLRLVRSYAVLAHLRRDITFFRHNEDVITSAIHLVIFIFVMTAVVIESQVGSNPDIRNYIDAMYFTVATLTTTGFGDIVLVGYWGKVLSILTMIFGVSLFIRLIQTVFRPNKVRYDCPDCGLILHDRDAVHCKHCGRVVDIPSEGL
jgi:voltage-gated potassium channel